MNDRNAIYVNGAWVPTEGPESIEVLHSATEEVIGRTPAGTASDVERAAHAARHAFDGWSRTPVDERAAFLEAAAAAIRTRTDEIARVIAAEVGMPFTLAKPVQVEMPAAVMADYAKLVRERAFEEPFGTSLIVSEAAGVVGAITPWNYPLHQVVAKVAPALAAGCTVVLKPSELAPLSAFILTDIFHELGLPPGVLNLVSGYGMPVGEALASHPEIEVLSFTGSTRAGRRVAELAAQTVKRTSLELGGKSASLVLDDADLVTAVKRSVSNAFFNGGQTCSAWTRLLVPRARYEEAVATAKQAAERFTVGDPFDPKTKLGPLVSKVQQERVRAYIRKGVEEGARLVTGDAEQPTGLSRGFYVKPTVFANVTNSMTIAREEIFGPVLCVMAFEDEEDGIRIANDSSYGLGGGVWSGDVERAKRVARRIRAGQVDINGGAFNPMAPFGGFKQSGHGREFGKWGLDEYLAVKSLQL